MLIAIVTSTKFDDPLKSRFYSGLSESGNWNADPQGTNCNVDYLLYEAEGNYDDKDGGDGAKKELYKAIETFSSRQEVKLIVALGGLVTAHAAVKKSTKPFLVLLGSDPTFLLGDQCKGGVNLGLRTLNAQRNQQLASRFHLTAADICLVWNARSKMGKQEKDDWVDQWPKHKRVSTNGKKTIEDAIADAATTLAATGLVISGDPFFTANKDLVVRAANAAKTAAGAQVKVSYPFPIYKDAHPGPLSSHSLIHGADLGAAYQTIGRKASTILDAIDGGGEVPNTMVSAAGTYGPEVPPAKKTAAPKRKKAASKKARKRK